MHSLLCGEVVLPANPDRAGSPCSAEITGDKRQVRASYLEIYNEDVRDLLAAHPRAALELREDADGGVYAKGLHAFLVQSPADLASVLQVAHPPAPTLMLSWHLLCPFVQFLFQSPAEASVPCTACNKTGCRRACMH